MKVVHMTSVHPPFDVRIFRRECTALAEHGFETVLIAPHEQDLAESGITVRAIASHSGGRLKRMLTKPLEIFRKAIAEDADVYHFHDPELLPVGLALRARGKKVIYDSHENLPRDVMHKPWIPGLLRRPVSVGVQVVESVAARYMTAIVTADEEIAARFSRVNKNVVPLRNYPRREEFSAIALNGNRFASGVIANFAGVNQDRVIREVVTAMGAISASDPTRLVLGGASVSDALLDSARAQPGWARVQYVGAVPRQRMLELLAGSCAAMVLYARGPNNMDVRSNRLFEAMAAGVPVIVPDFPKWRAVVEGRCGLCVNPHDPQQIADACTFLVNHPVEAERMGRAGREMFLREFNWDAEKKRLLDLYDGLCPSREPVAQAAAVAQAK